MPGSTPIFTSGAPAETDARPRLLLVDDEESILRSLRRTLRRCARGILTAANGEEALQILDQDSDVQVVVSDFRMPGMDGVEFLRRVKERWPRIQRVMLTGYADHRAIEDAINRSEVYRFISKPWDDGQLQITVESAWEQYCLVEENERLLRVLAEEKANLESKVAERTRALSVAKREWERSFDAIADPLAVVCQDGTIVRANLAFSEGAGRPITSLRGEPAFEVLFGSLSPEGERALREALESGGVREFRWRGEGRAYQVMAYAVPVDEESTSRAVVYFRDVTEEERMTRQLIQAEKMAAVGQLAGGVAHEINNPLAGILAFAQMMLQDPGRSEDDLEQLGHIVDSAKRCMRIVESLLSFSRQSNGVERGAVPVERLEQQTKVLSRPLVAGTDVAIHYQTEPGTPPFLGDANQIEQVLMNLVANAVHACGDAGTVRVHVGPGPRGVRIRVEDTGPGVAPEDEAKIFEPFYTTKEEGVGTGLGLSISYRIVDAHGGELSVGKSADLGGASFTVDLPAAEDS